MPVRESCATLAQIFGGDSDEQAGLVHSSFGAIFVAFSCGFRPSTDGEQNHLIRPQTRESLGQGEESMKRARLRKGFAGTKLLWRRLGRRAARGCSSRRAARTPQRGGHATGKRSRFYHRGAEPLRCTCCQWKAARRSNLRISQPARIW